MTIEQQIDAAVIKGQNISYIWASEFIEQINIGNKPCCEIKLFVLGQWLWILQDYKVYNFGDNGSVTPEYNCLTLDEIMLIISKINAIKC